MLGVNRDEMPLSSNRRQQEEGLRDRETTYPRAQESRRVARATSATRLRVLMSRKSPTIADDDKAGGCEIATKEWNGFLTDYKTGWEIWPAARSLARLHVELNKYDEAAKMWGRMAKNPELPPDLKLEASIEEIDSHFRAKAFSTAATLAGALGKSAGPGIAKDKLAMYEQAAKAAETGLKEDTVKPVVEAIEKKLAEQGPIGSRRGLWHHRRTLHAREPPPRRDVGVPDRRNGLQRRQGRSSESDEPARRLIQGAA